MSATVQQSRKGLGVEIVTGVKRNRNHHITLRKEVWCCNNKAVQ